MRAARRLRVTWLVLLASWAGCSNNTGPVGGTLDVRLSSPHNDDGAVLVSIAGGPVDSVETLGYTVYSARGAADTLRLIVTGNLGSGPIARIHISDSRQTFRYSARISQAAARGTFAQRDPAGYGTTLVP